MTSAEVRALDGSLKTLSQQQLDELGSQLRGYLVLPVDAHYDFHRQIWNAMIDRHPALIVRCQGCSDVVAAINFARQHQLLCSIRGAGHNIAGKALCDEAMLIDLEPMNSVLIDPTTQTALIGPGATLGDIDHETALHGLALPVGINSTTGIAGLTLGGGFGWLSRSHGLTIDNLIAAEVVTAAGQRIWCSNHQHPDLFWAVRGGGGNFGVVTLFEFKLHPIESQLMAGPVVYPFEQAETVLKAYRDFCAEAPEELTVWAVMRDAPPLPFLPEAVHGTRVLILVGLYNGPATKGAAALAPLKTFGTPLGEGIGPCPLVAFQQAFDPLLTPGARNYWKSHNFTALGDALISQLISHGANLPSPQSEIFIAQMGGATNQVAPDATAYPHRDVEFVMNVHTRWEEPADDRTCIDWARAFYKATEPFATGGVYVNFISEDEDRVQGAYGANMQRLAAIKAQYDPENFFRLNQNIAPR